MPGIIESGAAVCVGLAWYMLKIAENSMFSQLDDVTSQGGPAKWAKWAILQFPGFRSTSVVADCPSCLAAWVFNDDKVGH